MLSEKQVGHSEELNQNRHRRIAQKNGPSNVLASVGIWMRFAFSSFIDKFVTSALMRNKTRLLCFGYRTHISLFIVETTKNIPFLTHMQEIRMGILIARVQQHFPLFENPVGLTNYKKTNGSWQKWTNRPVTGVSSINQWRFAKLKAWKFPSHLTWPFNGCVSQLFINLKWQRLASSHNIKASIINK